MLTDLVIDLGEVRAFDLHPDPLPDLFAGSQLILVGRYRNPGTTTIVLRGTVEGALQEFGHPERIFRRSGGPEFLPRLWATRKIADLLNQIRLEGPQEELIQQVVHLSIRFGIVTPYTSYLVTEPSILGRAAEEGVAAEAFAEFQAVPPQVSGQAAVARAQAESDLSGAEIPVEVSGEAAKVVRVVGARAFRLLDGVWIDTAFDPQTMKTAKVPFLSNDYFALADASQVLASSFALGPRVVVMHDGTAYEVIGPEDTGDEFPLDGDDEGQPEALLPGPSDPAGADGFLGGQRSPTQICSGLAILLGVAFIPLAVRKRPA